MPPPRVWTRSAPERDHGGQGESGGVVAGQLVVAGGNPAEVLETAESGLDAPAFLIAALVVAQRALAGAGAGDDGGDALLPQISPQPIGVVALIGDQASQAAGSLGQHRWGGAHVTGVARRQQQDTGAAQHVDEGVDLRRLTTPRRADGLCCRPPLPP